MSKISFVLNAEARALQGTGASRRLRRTGFVPAIVYGGKTEPQTLSINHNELWKHLKHEAFYSHILTLNVGKDSEQVVLKDLHRHPVNETILHLDLQRVLADVVLRMSVPLHFIGADIAPGVKTGGGIIEHHLNQVEVECLPKHLPEFLEVDVSQLNVNEAVHLSQIKLPEGVVLVELKHDNDQSIAAVHLPRVAVETEAEATEAAATAEVPASAQKAPDAKGGAAAKGAAPAKGAPAAKKDDKKK